jgi:hypothetical protein
MAAQAKVTIAIPVDLLSSIDLEVNRLNALRDSAYPATLTRADLIRHWIQAGAAGLLRPNSSRKRAA